jgi:hypothetical protein
MFFDIFGQGPDVSVQDIQKGFNMKPVENTEVKEASITDIIKKPFMPSSWKWFRTEGEAKVYTFNAMRGVITTLEVNVPKAYRKYIVSSNGKQYPSSNGNLKIKMEGDTGDYIVIGGRESVTMMDAEPQGALVRVSGVKDIPAGARTLGTNFYYSTPPNPPTQTTFPSLRFRSDGVDYKLDWNLFAQERKLSKGSFGQLWGYPREGHPTYGSASAFDTDLKLVWNRSFKWWWGLLIAGAIGFGLKRFFSR